MKVIVDRFEEGFAVVELPGGEETALISRSLIPEAKEGDAVVIAIDEAETERRREEARSRFSRLFRKKED
ncbi:MAG: DUF3006 domain-containing protein [Clostridia bacterium]|nr:DUF3006 domain-containing protein [Clostridia bacterium]